MNTLGLLVVYLVITPVMAAVHYANDHPVLFNLISNEDHYSDNTGNNIVDNDDSVVLGVGTLSGSPSADSDSVYYPHGIYFLLVCSGTLHSCVLDGSNSRQIMYIWGTGGGTITLAGIHFLDGNSGGYGGALFIQSSALVSVQGCKLSSNQAQNGGAILHSVVARR
ncbi:hypothetical protein TrVE_jg10714 [Triparma verrucosa]|uniref:Uncharacterized protein n=1 Tax=Triparma verrucosa TaxID=1606542 RepID=A0A9W7CAZ4_9STRA|nr:hypothetical protein TrVE_jg10714 [Triparma verrucosa]